MHDNVDPTLGAFSVGTSVPGLDSETYYFQPEFTGTTNLDFSLVVPGGTVYCYGGLGTYPGAVPSGLWFSLLLQLTPEGVLRLEMQQGGSCGDGPFAFSGSNAEFER